MYLQLRVNDVMQSPKPTNEKQYNLKNNAHCNTFKITGTNLIFNIQIIINTDIKYLSLSSSNILSKCQEENS